MRSELASAALRIAWSQWTALGVSGTVALPDHAVDLEALIALTPVLRHEDPRLYDEARDWCVSQSQRLISLSRLRRLRAQLPEAACDAYDDFAATVNATAKPTTPWPTSRSATKLVTSGKSQPADLSRFSLLQLRLRGLFGITARAEVLVQFLRPIMTQELVPNTMLATAAFADLGYSKPALAEVLAMLAKAGLLESWRRGNRDYYQLARGDALLALVGGGLPATAPTWTVRFRVLADLLITEAATRDKKPTVQAIANLKILESHHDALERIGVKPPAQGLGAAELASWARHTLLDEPVPASDEPVAAHARRRVAAAR
ncbi:MAG TPA: winged helix-turn-helix domain-containing protein [Kofleriaceae bacterium]|jgi:hypothetical protein|nr:winged helix-turn-helix domain-containing protein [Kofleriaceae bacterium]